MLQQITERVCKINLVFTLPGEEWTASSREHIDYQTSPSILEAERDEHLGHLLNNWAAHPRCPI